MFDRDLKREGIKIKMKFFECLFCGFCKVEDLESFDLSSSDDDDIISKCNKCEGTRLRKCSICPNTYCPVCEGDYGVYICVDCIFTSIN